MPSLRSRGQRHLVASVGARVGSHRSLKVPLLELDGSNGMGTNEDMVSSYEGLGG